jgi:hypothetical protein
MMSTRKPAQALISIIFDFISRYRAVKRRRREPVRQMKTIAMLSKRDGLPLFIQSDKRRRMAHVVQPATETAKRAKNLLCDIFRLVKMMMKKIAHETTLDTINAERSSQKRKGNVSSPFLSNQYYIKFSCIL